MVFFRGSDIDHFCRAVGLHTAILQKLMIVSKLHNIMWKSERRINLLNGVRRDETRRKEFAHTHTSFHTGPNNGRPEHSIRSNYFRRKHLLWSVRCCAYGVSHRANRPENDRCAEQICFSARIVIATFYDNWLSIER